MTSIPSSIEVSPKQAVESEDLPGLFPAGTRVYITDVGTDPAETLTAGAKRVADLGYKPATSVEDGVANFVSWYRNDYKV